MAKIEAGPTDFTSYGLSCVRWIPSPMRRPDHHNEIQLNLLCRGQVTYLLGSQTVQVKPGHLTAFWAAIPHQIVAYAEDTEYFVATLPLAWFLQCQLPDSLVQPLMRGKIVTEPRAARAEPDMALFRQWQEDLALNDRAIREVVIMEMKTRLHRLAVTLRAQKPGAVARVPARLALNGLTKVEQMVCFIAQSYMEPITVTDIGKAVGLHPNSAMRLFKRVFGETLIDHLTHHRIFHAKRLLATSDQKIVDVAFGSGFTSISRFNAAFRRACGCTPRDYRADHEQTDAAEA